MPDSEISTEVDSALGDPERLNAKVVAARRDYEMPRARKVLGALREETADQDVLRLEPKNLEAKRAFDSVVRLKKAGTLSDIHTQSLRVTGEGPLKKTPKVNKRPSNETTPEPCSDDEDSRRIVSHGYFRVGFRLPVSHPVRWTVGRGTGKAQKLPDAQGEAHDDSRKVDILLAAPKSTTANKLNANHALLRIHERSGAWLLRALGEMEVAGQTIPVNGSTILSQPETLIEIAGMEYYLRFVIENEGMEQVYIDERNRVLSERGIPIPDTYISGVPMPIDTKLESIVFRGHGLDSGTFGAVFEGFHPRTGDIRVVKVITIKKARDIPAVDWEIQALERFRGREGILELLEWNTARSGKNLYGDKYPVFVYLVHERGVAFNKVDWTDRSMGWDIRRLLFRQLLKGLEVIHKAGCMHRDITPQNILLFPSEEGPRAVLCDFGKFCNKATDTNTALAAWQYLPPEIQRKQDGEELNTYGQAIDIWMLGLALTRQWWPQLSEYKSARNMGDHANILNRLKTLRDGGNVGCLVAQMMEWHQTKRPTAGDLLADPYFHGASKQQAPVKTSDGKRLHEQ